MKHDVRAFIQNVARWLSTTTMRSSPALQETSSSRVSGTGCSTIGAFPCVRKVSFSAVRLVQ
jgi:hypothetical protein